MLVKIHKGGGRAIVAMADKDLIGKELSDGERYLKVSEYFYKGEEKEEEEILNLLIGASSINVVGKESINFCTKNKLTEKENVLKVKNIPYAIILFNDE